VTTKTHVIHCPSCGARDVRHSMSRGFLDAVIGALGRSPMRCRQCQKRFYRRLPRQAEEGDRTNLKESERD
jgi:hypothetical protein